MPDQKLTLITGRSTVQGTGISTGKGLEDYQAETTAIHLSPSDMDRLGLEEGQAVRVRSGHGEVVARCRRGDLPEGLAFMAFGPATSQISGGETDASGMPDTKGVEIELESAPA
jgi:formylmethanofuran dehydrogenase subunit D